MYIGPWKILPRAKSFCSYTCIEHGLEGRKEGRRMWSPVSVFENGGPFTTEFSRAPCGHEAQSGFKVFNIAKRRALQPSEDGLVGRGESVWGHSGGWRERKKEREAMPLRFPFPFGVSSLEPPPVEREEWFWNCSCVCSLSPPFSQMADPIPDRPWAFVLSFRPYNTSFPPPGPLMH